MGLKDNFKQALSELTGGSANQPVTGDKAQSSKVEDLRRAVEAETVESAAVQAAPSAVIQPAAVQAALQGSSPAQFAENRLAESAHPAAQALAAINAQPSPIAPKTAEGITSVQPASNPSAGNAFGDFPSAGSPLTTGIPAPAASRVPDDVMGDEMTIISKNTVVEGNIRSFANMNVDGNVRGDIETTKNIELNGKIIGNLTCNNAQMMTSQIQGNIRMKGNVIMGRDTLLIGDLVSTYAKVNGKIKGNLEVGGKAELKGDSVIFGDISASTITVDDGAIIQGFVSTTFLNKEESRNIFPESISIAE